MAITKCSIPGYKICPSCAGSGNRIPKPEPHKCERCGVIAWNGWEMFGQDGFHRVCLACRDDIKHGGHYEGKAWVAADDNCCTCQGEGIVPHEICASCFESGKVVEMDGYNAGGEPMCYDCLDARDDVQPGD